ncbi:MAG TPA: DMT family transporter [Thermoanaerobaculia bacterium]
MDDERFRGESGTEAAAGGQGPHRPLSLLAARLGILAAAVLFSSGGAAIKSVHLSGWQVAGTRSGIAALALLALLPRARRLPRARDLAVAVVFAVTMVLFVLANKLTTAASTIFLQDTSPLYVVLLAPLLLKEPLRRRDLPFIAVLAAGMTLFFVGLDPTSATAPDPLRGDLLALLSGLAWAGTVIGLRFLGRAGGSSASATVWGNLIACLAGLAMALPLAVPRPGDWAILVYLGTCQIGVAYYFLTRALEVVPALEAALLLLLEPVLNPIWAWIVHGERPSAWSLAGGAVILAATGVKSWVDVRGPRPQPPESVALS